MRFKSLALAAPLANQASAAFALNILLTNDDGFETANLRALSERLRASGHAVVISAPTQSNSGRGAFVEFLRPVTPPTRDTRRPIAYWRHSRAGGQHPAALPERAAAPEVPRPKRDAL